MGNRAIDKALPKMKPPRCAIYFNITGKKVSPGTNPAEFVDLMKRQMTNEVLWEPCIKQMIMDQVKDFYEVGPLKQIKSMIKRIDQDAFKRTENIPCNEPRPDIQLDSRLFPRPAAVGTRGRGRA